MREHQKRDPALKPITEYLYKTQNNTTETDIEMPNFQALGTVNKILIRQLKDNKLSLNEENLLCTDKTQKIVVPSTVEGKRSNNV